MGLGLILRAQPHVLEALLAPIDLLTVGSFSWKSRTASLCRLRQAPVSFQIGDRFGMHPAATSFCIPQPCAREINRAPGCAQWPAREFVVSFFLSPNECRRYSIEKAKTA